MMSVHVMVALQKAIDAVCPNVGFSVDDHDAVIAIDFTPEATAEQQAAAWEIAKAFDFLGAQAKIDNFDAAISAGFDTGLGWRLPLDETSRGELDKLRNQLREGIDLGFLTNDSPCPIQLLDTAGVGHSMTVGQVRQLIFAGRNYYAGLVAAAR